MEIIKKTLKKIDIAGVPPTHTVEGQETLFKSVKGGLLSILIISLSMSYTFYTLFLWYDGKIIPKTLISQLQVNYQEIIVANDTINFVFQTPTSDPLDPFQQDQIILIPIVSISSNSIYSVSENIVLDKSQPNKQILFLGQPTRQQITSTSQSEQKTKTSSQSKSSSKSSIQSEEDITNTSDTESEGVTLVYNQNELNPGSNNKNNSQILVTFVKCSPELLKENQQCANQSVKDNYFNSSGKRIYMKIKFEVFNSGTQNFNSKYKSYYYLLDDNLSLFNQVIFKTKQMSVYHGLLFQDEIKKKFLDSVEIQSQTISFQQSLLLFGQISYASFLISLDSIIEYEQVSYATLGEVGAQIGSIINIIMLIQLLIVYNNNKEYQSKLIDVIISENQDTNIEKDQNIPTSAEKQTALAQTNIFNIHIELSKLRILLNQLKAQKEYDYEQFMSSISDEPHLKCVQNQQIGQFRNLHYKDKDATDAWQKFQNALQSKRENLIKKPDKVKLIELQTRREINYIARQLDTPMQSTIRIGKPQDQEINNKVVNFKEGTRS